MRTLYWPIHKQRYFFFLQLIISTITVSYIFNQINMQVYWLYIFRKMSDIIELLSGKKLSWKSRITQERRKKETYRAMLAIEKYVPFIKDIMNSTFLARNYFKSSLSDENISHNDKLTMNLLTFFNNTLFSWHEIFI